MDEFLEWCRVFLLHLDQDDQDRWGAAVDLLRDDKARLVRIDIETASIITLNEEDNKNQATEMMNTISSFMLNTTQAIQQSPEVAPLMFKLLSNCLFMYPQGKLDESIVPVTNKIVNPYSNIERIIRDIISEL